MFQLKRKMNQILKKLDEKHEANFEVNVKFVADILTSNKDIKDMLTKKIQKLKKRKGPKEDIEYNSVLIIFFVLTTINAIGFGFVIWLCCQKRSQ